MGWSPRDASTTAAQSRPIGRGLTIDRATQVVWTLTSPEVHLLMRDTGGWSEPSYREWLEQAIADGILPEC